MRGADLVVFDIASGRTSQLTTDGNPGTIENGHRASWNPDGLYPVRLHGRPQTSGLRARRPDLSHLSGTTI